MNELVEYTPVFSLFALKSIHPCFTFNGLEYCCSESVLCTPSPSGLVKLCLSLFSYTYRMVFNDFIYFQVAQRLPWGWCKGGGRKSVGHTIPCCGPEAGLGVGGGLQWTLHNWQLVALFLHIKSYNTHIH